MQKCPERILNPGSHAQRGTSEHVFHRFTIREVAFHFFLVGFALGEPLLAKTWGKRPDSLRSSGETATRFAHV
jgi:hypothetical protein